MLKLEGILVGGPVWAEGQQGLQRLWSLARSLGFSLRVAVDVIAYLGYEGGAWVTEEIVWFQ